METVLDHPSNIGCSALNDRKNSIQDKIEAVDWSFQDRVKAHAIESIHPYPAKFIGDIPRAIIEKLPIPKGTGILDPFSGSGTSLIEAQRAGIASVGIDLNPIACLISRVKTQPVVPGFMEIVQEIIVRARSIESLPASDIPNVTHWFKPEVQLAVGALAQLIAEPKYNPWLDQLRLSLSSILVKVSNQDSDTRYAAVENNITYIDVFESFNGAATKLIRALGSRTWDLKEATVLEANTLEVQPSEIKIPIGLVVTSPPYPNAYEYWLYHKYRMWWLGFDPIAVKEKEIGARAHFFKKNPHTADHFIDQMRGTFKLIDGVLVKNGFICFVVGRSKIHGNVINNGDIVENLSREFDLSLISRFERVIKTSRKSFNLSHANIKTETVLIFQKS